METRNGDSAERMMLDRLDVAEMQPDTTTQSLVARKEQEIAITTWTTIQTVMTPLLFQHLHHGKQERW